MLKNIVISGALLIVSNLGYSLASKKEWVAQCENATGEAKKTFDAIRKVKQGRWIKASCGKAYDRVLLQNHLNLSQKALTDLSPLSDFSHLVKLNLSDNHISDLEPISSLTKLKSLNLNRNEISALEPLVYLTSLSALSLDYNCISDLEPLSGLDLWLALSLRGNQISDLSPLAEVSKLCHLKLDKNKISDLTPLEGLPIEWISLCENYIKDFDPVPASAATVLRGMQY